MWHMLMGAGCAAPHLAALSHFHPHYRRVCCAPFGGPIAVVRDERQMVVVAAGGSVRPVIRTFASSGRPLGSHVWDKGRIVGWGWSGNLELVVVDEAGKVAVLSMRGERVREFSMGTAVEKAGVAKVRGRLMGSLHAGPCATSAMNLATHTVQCAPVHASVLSTSLHTLNLVNTPPEGTCVLRRYGGAHRLGATGSTGWSQRRGYGRWPSRLGGDKSLGAPPGADGRPATRGGSTGGTCWASAASGRDPLHGDPGAAPNRIGGP